MASGLSATQLILDALRPHQTPTTWESDVTRLQADWDDLAVRAIVLGLAPQFHIRLNNWGLDIGARASEKLSANYQAQALRNEAIFAQLSEALIACVHRGLRPIALKGVHLAALVYSDPAMRPMNDIDLLFTPEELPAAEAMLEALGYGGRRKPADLGPGVTKHTSTFRRAGSEAATPNPYLSTGADRTIEPHTSLEESWFGLKVDVTPGVRDRSNEATLAGQPCRVLAREDLLLHLCVHFCFHLIMGAPSMVQLADLLAVTSAGGVDRQAFAERAVSDRAAPYTLAALMLSRKLLDAPVPNDVIDTLSRATPAALRRRIDRLSLADVLRRTQQKPLTSIPQRIRRGLVDRAETARWAVDWPGKWGVWKTALRVGSTDTWRMVRDK
ncbi:MAG TPA: nucleotidyltransferase family protein [Anaerolineae bacterium]|nr:nucleotidyltransferase family protein [Anaerolineae bacterium]